VRILGIDPGTVCTGWGLVERSGSRVRGLDAGTLRTSSKSPLEARLRRIHGGLVEVLEQHDPEAVAIEDIFYAKHANAALKLGHVRGIALLAAANAELEVFAYPPALVKRTIAGRGKADKKQVAYLVGAILGWRELPTADATDALAIAITHAQASQVKGRTAAAAQGSQRSRR
jgi:crossover junction endodeoxyribonuclease RuvC